MGKDRDAPGRHKALVRVVIVGAMVLSGYFGATSVERPATSSPSMIELEPATNIEFMGNAAPAASLPEQRDAPAEPPSFPVAAVPASSPNAPAAPARSLGGAIPRADCTASPHCRAQVQRFIVDRTHGFNVGGSSGLKWLTKHMHLLAQAGGKMDAPVVIDVGAGKYGPEGGTDDSDALILLGLLCKPTTNCTVHAFEAIPAKANQLPEEARKRQSTKHLTRFFHAHAAGLGKVTSTLVLYPPGSPKSYNNYKVAVNGFVPPLARPNAVSLADKVRKATLISADPFRRHCQGSEPPVRSSRVLVVPRSRGTSRRCYRPVIYCIQIRVQTDHIARL